MLLVVIRKIFKNKWLSACLIIGCVLAVSVMSSIPMYSYAMFQRMLVKDLESIRTTRESYPGVFNLTYSLATTTRNADETYQRYAYYDDIVTDYIQNESGLEIVESYRLFSQSSYFVAKKGQKPDRNARSTIVSAEGIEEHVEMIAGRLPSSELVDGCFEVMARDILLERTGMLLDGYYELYESTQDEKCIPVHVVGIFTVANEADIYWLNSFSTYYSGVVMNYDLFEQEFLQPDSGRLSGKVSWCNALDYTGLTVDNIGEIGERMNFFLENTVGSGFAARQYMLSILQNYNIRYERMFTTLWILMIPLILMLVFYIYMVSQISLNYERNEIAVMKSRGSSNLQILRLYFYESTIFGVVSLLIGIPLGFFFCRVVGATSGFLEFVQRKAIVLKLSPEVVLYAVIAAVMFIATMLIPVISAARTTIVKHKQGKAGKRKLALWEKLGLDVICLAIAGYGLYTYKQRQLVLFATNASTSDIPIDPLLFVMSTLFILGAGMLFIRIFPYVIKLIYWIGKRFWSPVLYYSLINVSRSGGQDKFVMLFLVLTLSLGIFNSTAARTINRNEEDKIKYSIGADMVFRTEWQGIEVGGGSDSVPGFAGMAGGGKMVYNYEPLFDPYRKMDGVEHATKVYTNNNASVRTWGNSRSDVRYMGVVADEFAETSWYRKDLFKHEFYEYLNLLASDARAVLISSSLAEKLNAEVGDLLIVTMPTCKERMDVIVFAIVDYWPTFNPNIQTTNSRNSIPAEFMVGNLDYMYKEMVLDPYDVWLDIEDGYSSADIYRQLNELEANVVTMKDTSQSIIAVRNDPMLQGINGTLTMSFIITMAVTLIGFTIYWIFAIKGRMLQFGILRSMGLSKFNLIMMLVWEQILISGSSVAAGTLIGTLAARLYVPLFQIVSDTYEQVPPFRILMLQSDYIRIFIVVGVMLLVGMTVLSVLISNMKLVQTLKLGED